MSIQTALTDEESSRVAESRRSAAAVVAAARELSVSTADEAERASGILRDLATVRKRADSERKALTQPYRAHVEQINAQYREPTSMLDEADGMIRAKVQGFLAEQERMRAERQARIDAEAAEQRRRDEAEREAQAAAARAQHERWAREQAEREAEAARTGAREDAERAAAAKAAADAMAELERAREIAPLPVRHVPTVEPVKPSAGIAVKRPWTFEVVDPQRVPREFLTVDERLIRRVMREEMRAHGEPLPIPGVRFYQQEGLSVRGR